jgi:hypothetical protein
LHSTYSTGSQVPVQRGGDTTLAILDDTCGNLIQLHQQ